MNFLWGLRMLLAGDVGATTAMQSVLDEAVIKPMMHEIERLKSLSENENDSAKADDALEEATRIQGNLDGIQRLFDKKWFDMKTEKVADVMYNTKSKGLWLDRHDFINQSLLNIWKRGPDAWKKLDPKKVTSRDIELMFTANINNAIKTMIKIERRKKIKEYSINTEEGEGDSDRIVDNRPGKPPFARESEQVIRKGISSAVASNFGKKSLEYALWLAWWKKFQSSSHIEKHINLLDFADDKLVQNFYEGSPDDGDEKRKFILKLRKSFGGLNKVFNEYLNNLGINVRKNPKLHLSLNARVAYSLSGPAERVAYVKKQQQEMRIVLSFLLHGLPKIAADEVDPEEMVEELRKERARGKKRYSSDVKEMFSDLGL